MAGLIGAAILAAAVLGGCELAPVQSDTAERATAATEPDVRPLSPQANRLVKNQLRPTRSLLNLAIRGVGERSRRLRALEPLIGN